MSDLLRALDEDRGAELSADGVYRYALWRRWNRLGPRALFIMLNPSTADAAVDDPTIRRCISFARKWNMGGIRVVNLFALRATDPAELLKAKNPQGDDNFGFIERSIDKQGIAIAAWGANKAVTEQIEWRARNLFRALGVPLYALRITSDGHPGHPLYVPSATTPVVYEPAGSGLSVGAPWKDAEARG